MKKEKTVDIPLRTSNFNVNESTYEYSLIMKKPRALTHTPLLYSVRLDITRDGSSAPEVSEVKNFFDMGQAIVYFDKLVEGITTPRRLNRILKI